MLSVVVPCYNESGNIELLLQKFAKIVIPESDIEVIFVNNGSKDDSAEVFTEELKKYPSMPFRVVHVPQNKGYGHGILYGLRHAKGDILSWTHADLQTEPTDIITGLELYKQYNDPMLFVKGKRKNRNLLDAFFTYGMQVFSSLTLHTPLDDINAQPKIFSRVFFDKIQADAPLDFSLDLYFLYFATKQGRIVDFPVYFKKRYKGEAKGGGSLKGKYRLIKRTYKYILYLKKHLSDINSTRK